MIKLDELFSSTTVTVCNNMPTTIQGDRNVNNVTGHIYMFTVKHQ